MDATPPEIPRVKPKAYLTATAFRLALEDRLAATAKSEGVDLGRLRCHVAFDWFLVRIFTAPCPPWMLKGGYALELKITAARTTKDINLGIPRLPGDERNWEKSVHLLLDVLQEKAVLDADDFFSFVVGEASMELDAAPYSGARFPVEAVLDDRTFAKFHVDVGAGDVQREPAEFVQARPWLEFAGIGATAFPSIAREEHFAQKIHAYTFPREDRPDSRVKDLVDLVLLIDLGGLDPDRLKRDITDTFARRRTHAQPLRLEAPPDFWAAPFSFLAAECGIDPDIAAQLPR